VLIREPGPEPLVIDFEGEPGRSLEDRRRKTSVCKDIAGMCRSFDYLLRHAARSGSTPYRAADLTLLEATFLDAYRAVAREHAWWPADAATADALLDIYKLDKAVYELAYELANRPDWVEVPLAALA
jgi:predicted trehalose synthase